MIESDGRFPAFEAMAAAAFRAELAAMLVGVARGATIGNSEISMIGFPYPDGFSCLRRHVVCRMAAVAANSGVLAQKHVAGLPMIELVVRRFPLDDVELRPQVFRVAADAILVPSRALHHCGVEPLPVCKPLSDFRMAPSAPEFSCAQSETVAGDALGGAFQTRVCLRQGAR